MVEEPQHSLTLSVAAWLRRTADGRNALQGQSALRLGGCAERPRSSTPRYISALLAAALFCLAASTPAGFGAPIHGTVLYPQETIVASALNGPNPVAHADLDSDGFPDVIIVDYVTAGSSTTGRIGWRRNNGDGTFAATHHLVATFPDAAVGSFAPGDLDNDGRIDLAYWVGDGTIRWSRNVGGSLSNGLFGFTGTPAADLRVVAVVPSFPESIISIADLNADSHRDLLSVTGNTDNKVAWYRNPGGGFLGKTISGVAIGNPATVTTSGSHGLTTGVSVTISGVAGATSVPTINATYVVTVTGANTFTVPVDCTAPATANTGRFVAATPIVVSTAAKDPSSIRGADLNGDGHVDFVVTSRLNMGANDTIAWFQSNGAVPVPTFTRRIIPSTLGGGVVQTSANNSALGDIDGDGRLDVVCTATTNATTNPQTPRVHWFRNTSADPGAVPPFFSGAQVVTGEVPSLDPTFSPAGLDTADLNSDGVIDVLVSATRLPFNQPAKVYWVENLGGGNFNWNAGNVTANQRSISAALFDPYTVLAVDFNNDGPLDVLTNAVINRKVSAFLNKGGQTALTALDMAPAPLTEGRRDDLLRIGVSHRGVAGDTAAQIATVGLLFEKSEGVVMTTAEANARIDRLELHLDANDSGVFELGTDVLVGTLPDLNLVAGRQVFTITPVVPADAQVAAGQTRSFFLVAKIAVGAAAQTPNAFRATHLSNGIGRSTLKDAANNASLTIEALGNVNTASSFVSSLAAHTYSEYAFVYFDSNTAPGTGPLDDFDFDGHSNLAEFGFGMDPTVAGTANLALSGAVLSQRGLPIARATNTGTGVTYEAIFGRRKDTLAGLTYAVQFSANLTTWVTSTATPVVLADDGVIEAVSVPYPLFVNGRKARFFRVQVTSP